jgi:hypothetical protein
MKQVEINPTNEYHILRHFKLVPQDYAARLIGKHYFYHNVNRNKFESGTITEENIEMAVKTTGSKFSNQIPGITTPIDILNLIKSEFIKIPIEKQVWRGDANKRFFSFLISTNYPVGVKNLINISELTAEERLRIRKVPRSRHVGEGTVMVNTIDNIPTRTLHTIEVGLIDTVELPFYFVTAFPGDLEEAPDFPNSEQSKSDYELSLDYWNNHVFVI